MNKETRRGHTKASHPVDLVIFDCDGVLIDSEVISATIIIKQLKAAGVSVDRNYVYEHFLGQNFSNVVRKVRRNFNVKLGKSFQLDYRQALLTAFESSLRPTQGVENVLSDLAVSSCVATSSSPPRTERALELVGLTDFFGANVFTASEVKKGKPAPDLFLHAAAKMNVAPNNCLVIEDSLSGLTAAMAAGMNVWRFTGGSHLISAAGHLPSRFSGIPSFQNWQEFYTMAPDLRKTHSVSRSKDGR